MAQALKSGCVGIVAYVGYWTFVESASEFPVRAWGAEGYP